ncbi:unnamed protein product [Allacma fusca]|uniref:Uncharacterized protein n=1 Tax=Allacma fusca TaxID=39272 RepID=A0A8J2KZ76_9HEXA|nr:unnamed protein product [Allacma fusca]
MSKKTRNHKTNTKKFDCLQDSESEDEGTYVDDDIPITNTPDKDQTISSIQVVLSLQTTEVENACTLNLGDVAVKYSVIQYW